MRGINVSHNEQKAALYLGYEDLGLFRAYLCSHLFLDYFLEWTVAGGQGMAPRSAKILEKQLKEEWKAASLWSGKIAEFNGSLRNAR